MTFDDLVLLDGLETAVVSITDSIETVVGKGFVARFPGSCSLHLLVNEVSICNGTAFNLRLSMYCICVMYVMYLDFLYSAF